MLSSLMQSHGESLLKNIMSQILGDKKAIENESELNEVLSIFKAILDGNKYIKSSLTTKKYLTNEFPISKEELILSAYNSIQALTIDNEKIFQEEIDQTMKRLIDISIAERKAKKYEEQRQESNKTKESKPVEESKPIPQQLYYPEQNPSIPYPELNQPQQPQPQILPQTQPMYQEEEFDENADFTLQDVIDGRLVIRPTDSIEVARKKLALSDGKTKRFANAIFNNQLTNPQQNVSEYDRVKKIFKAFKCKIDKDSSYEDKQKYISERAMLYNSIYKDDTSKYLVEDKENVVMMGLQSICVIMGEDINNINCTSNKQLLSDLGRFLSENVNEENIDRAIMCVNLFESYVLVQIKDMNL